MSLIVDEHREYLSDPVRLGAFDRALAETAAAGAVVADLGTGTGILGLLALKAGAARVYAIDRTGMVGIARALARANGVSDRFHVIKAHSADLELPERVDVIVGDFLGRFGFNAGIFDVYPPAARAFLKPDGRLIPSRISLFIAPVESAAMDTQVRFWATPRQGVCLVPALEWAINTGYPVTFAPDDLLGDGVGIAHASTAETPAEGFFAEPEIEVRRAGTCHGLAGWFSAQLSPGVTLTNDPRSRERVGKRNVFLPIRRPVTVSPGDRISVRIRILPMDLIVDWRVSVRSADGEVRATCAQSTVNGMLLTREDLQRAHPDFIPTLTRGGIVERTILELCDGVRPLREIERIVYERHGTMFASRGAASALVAEVTSRCSRP